MTDRLEGVIAPNLTPFRADFSIHTDLYVRHGMKLLEDGCVGLAPFGTTGEALSVGIDERIAAITALIDAGAPAAKIIPGTGLTNIADTARLSRACLDMGCKGVMTLPPFYFKNVPDEGLYAYFEQLIGAIGEDARIYLYHIPQVAGVGIPVSVAAKLRADFPDQIVGIKDSSGVWDNTSGLLEIDGMIVYPGSELPVLEAMDMGAPGCISATANVNAPQIADVIRRKAAGDAAGAAELHETVKGIRKMWQEYAPIPWMKRLIATSTGEEDWARMRPPLMSVSAADGQALADRLRESFDFRI